MTLRRYASVLGLPIATLLACWWLAAIHDDGWYVSFTLERLPVSPRSLVRYTHDNYLHGNPRFGQTVTYVLYGMRWASGLALGCVAGTAWLLLTIGLARRPRREDLGVAVTLVAMLLVIVPEAGICLTYWPYFGNYVVGAMPALGLLALMRVQLAQGRLAAWWMYPFVAMLGLGAGLGNEHTGPALACLMLGLSVVAQRQRRFVPWMAVASIAHVVGLWFLLRAPGQRVRYDGMANQGLWAPLLQRPWLLSAAIAVSGLGLVLLAGPWLLTLRGAGRRAVVLPMRSWAGAMLGVAVLVSGTLVVSPKLGARLYFLPAALLASALAPVVWAHGVRRWVWRLNLGVIAISCVGMLWVALVQHQIYGPRQGVLAVAAPQTVIELPRRPWLFWQWARSEEFGNQALKRYVAMHFGVAEIRLLPTRSL